MLRGPSFADSLNGDILAVWGEHRPSDPCKLVGQGYGHDVTKQSLNPSAERRIFLGETRASRAHPMDQQYPQVTVAALADVQQPRFSLASTLWYSDATLQHSFSQMDTRGERSPKQLRGREWQLVALTWRSRLPGAAAIEPLAGTPRAGQLLIDVVRHTRFDRAAPLVVLGDQARDGHFDEGRLVGIEEQVCRLLLLAPSIRSGRRGNTRLAMLVLSLR
jgi:hypothetical protein